MRLGLHAKGRSRMTLTTRRQAAEALRVRVSKRAAVECLTSGWQAKT